MTHQNAWVLFFILLSGEFLSGYFGPWYAPAIFIIAVTLLLKPSVKQAMLLGGVSLALVYLAMSLFQFSKDDMGIVFRTGHLMGGLSPVGMFFISTLTGGITGALSGWIGSTFRDVLKK